VIVYLPSLIFRPLFIGDEVRYAQIAQEMVRSGDWIVPRFMALKYFEKPVLGYWIDAIGILLFGEHELSVRLSELVAVLGTALLIFWLINRATKDTIKGVTAAVAYLLSPLVFVIGTLNILDNLFTLFVTASFVAFYCAIEREGSERRNWAIAAGIACGCAVLTKGFLGIVLPIAVIGPYLCWSRQIKSMILPCIVSVAMAVIVVVPWGVAIHLRDHDFWNYFFWEEHVRRFTAKDAQHPEPFWFFVPFLFLAVITWLPGIPTAFRAARSKQLSSFDRYLVFWFGVTFLFFSMSRGKLPTYILPCIPPVAIFFANRLVDGCRSGVSHGLHRGMMIGAGLTTLTAIVLAILNTILLPEKAPFPWSIQPFTALSLIIVLLVFSGLAYQASRAHDWQPALSKYGISLAILLLVAGLTLPDRFVTRRAPGRDMQALAPLVTDDTVILVDQRLASSVGWYLHHWDPFIAIDPNEFRYGLSRPEAAYRFLADKEQINNVIQNYRERNKPIAVIWSARRWEKAAENFPKSKQVDQHGEVLLLRY